VPTVVQAVAGWSWRLLLIGAVVYFAVQLAVALRLVLLTLLVGLLLTALLHPVVGWLHRRGVPRLAATWMALLGALALAAGVFLYIAQRAAANLQMLRQNVATGLTDLRSLVARMVGLSRDQVTALTERLIDRIAGSSDTGLPVPVMHSATVVLSVLAAAALGLFTAFWLLYDGERVWRFVARLAPHRYRATADEAGRRAWATLGGYLRGVTLVALVDAVAIGIALVILGVPLPFALALLTFFGAYVPLIGATIAGMAAVLVALAANGPTTALLTLVAVIVIQQVEGQLLQPIIMGRSMDLHPLVIAYALTIGGVLYGLAGAVVAVPLAAVVSTVGAYLATRGNRRVCR